MTERRKYPVGIQTFSRIISEGYVYIDKTDLMWQMTKVSPTTLCSFFEGRRAMTEYIIS